MALLPKRRHQQASANPRTIHLAALAPLFVLCFLLDPSVATRLRTLPDLESTLARLDRLARLGRRDNLGIGAVAAYVAAVEAGSIRVRAVLTGLVAGWPADLVAEYLAPERARAPRAGTAD